MNKSISLFIIFFLTGGILCGQSQNEWTLEECIGYALSQNIQVRKSENSTRRAIVYYDQAKARRYPYVNGSANQTFNWNKNTEDSQAGFTGSNGSNFALNAGATLFSGLKISNQIKQSQLDIQSSEYALEATRESVSLNILNAYLQVLYSGEQVRNSRRQIETTEEQLRLAGERLALKAISASDYSQVKAQLASEKLTLANSVSQLSIARINLMQLMELPVTEDFMIAEPDLAALLIATLSPEVKAVYETALSIKPQIKNAALNKQIAGLDETIARAAFYPVLTASAGISTGYSATATDIYFNQLYDGMRPSIGLSLAIPIYQNKQIKTNVAVAKLGYNDAVLSETDTRNQLRKNIEQACLDVTSAQVEFDASMEKYNAIKESAALSEEKFVQGLINSVDYLVSKTNLIVAESQLLQSKYNLIFSYKILDFYEGIPLSL